MIEVSKCGLFGSISLSGAKNAALPILVAAGLCSEPVTLNNMPTGLNDVKVMVELLREAGIQVEVNEKAHKIYINKDKSGQVGYRFSSEASKIRYSLLLLPLALAFNMEAHIPSPGGCNLGDRKYDIHLETLTKLGAQVNDDGETISCYREKKLHGAELLFHIATTSGSESAIIAGVLAEGKTIIRNANTRPEVLDLIHFLNAMGAKIKYKTRYIEIDGVDCLRGGEYTILSDRHEGISYAILAAMCRSELRIKDFNLDYVQEDATLLRKIGIDIFEWGGDVFISAKNKKLLPFSMATGAYPGINSDMQPLFAALALTIDGESIVTDTRFTERFQYVEEFRKLGAKIENYENCAIIQGGTVLKGCQVVATDLRAGAALTFLGGIAEGVTTITNYYQTERGYENIIEKLSSIGYKIAKLEE